MKLSNKPARAELTYLRESVLRAIRGADVLTVEEGLEVYRELVRVFIAKLKMYGADYDKALSIREASAFPGETWPALEWIQSDFGEILAASFDHPNKKILRAVLYFPVSVARIALHENDYFTFHQLALAFPEHTYGLANRLEDSELRTLAVELIGTHLREVDQFDIAATLERAGTKKELKHVFEIAEGILLIFGRLLKAAFDRRQLDHFRNFLMEMNRLFDSWGERLPGYERWVLMEPHPIDGDEAENHLGELYTSLQDQLGKLQGLRDVTRFGLNAWITKKYGGEELDAEEYRGWFEACGTFGDFVRLTNTYLLARKYETQDLLRWDWWVLEGAGDQMVAIDLDAHVDRAYVIHALRTGTIDDAKRAAVRDIEGIREVEYLAAKEDAPVRTMVATIQNEKERWAPVLKDGGEVSVEAFTIFLDKLVQHAKDEWTASVIDAELSPRRVAEFKSCILKGYEMGAEIRDFFLKEGRYEWAGEHPGGKDRWGFNVLLPKEYFVEESNVWTVGLGENYGTNVAAGLGQVILKAVVPELQERSLDNREKSVIEDLRRASREAAESGLSPVILLLGGWRAHADLFDHKGFVPEHVARGRKHATRVGFLDDTPVHSIRFRGQAAALVADFRKLGVWKQFQPKLTPDHEEVLGKELVFRLTPVSEEDARRYVSERPDEFRETDEDGQMESVEDAVRRLRQRVYFRVLAQAEFVLESKDAGFRFSISE